MTLFSYVKSPLTTIVFYILFTVLITNPFIGISQNLTSSTDINITKSWSQEPNGYTYPINIHVPPGPAPEDGFPVCVLLHGNGGNGHGMTNQFKNTLMCHILVGPSGYQNSWNICAENSDAPDIEMIEDLVTKLQDYDNVNPNKIRIVGSSNGAGLANRVFIENENSGIDIICAIVSHLNEAQYHLDNFYKPSTITNPNSQYCGYDEIVTPLNSRKYLSISNVNDNLIPYSGGLSVVGLNFLPAEIAVFNIAKHNGYIGDILSSGTNIGSPENIEFSYLDGKVVHLKGNAMHSTNSIQKEYIKSFLSDCESVSTNSDLIKSRIEIYPNPTSDFINAKIDISLLDSYYSIHDLTGKKIMEEKIDSENILIELSHLSGGFYFLKIDNNFIKILKE